MPPGAECASFNFSRFILHLSDGSSRSEPGEWLKAKKRRHERYFVRAGRPVTQLKNSQQARELCSTSALFFLTYVQMLRTVPEIHLLLLHIFHRNECFLLGLDKVYYRIDQIHKPYLQ